MNTTKTTQTRPQLETLACVNERCESYGQVGRNNLTIRKIYGKDEIRYLLWGGVQRAQAHGVMEYQSA
jgi:hypothetical protein